MFQSFQSGRLYSQIETMTKFYAHTCLLVEFSADKAFILQSSSEIFSELRPSHTCSKFSMLILAFPSMRILWSRSPHATASLFRSLKTNHPEPDEIAASKIGVDEQHIELEGEETRRGKNEYDRDVAIEVLQTLPGINRTNYRSVIKCVNSLADLCRMREAQLADMIGAPNARKLYTFLHNRVTDTVQIS